MIELSMKMFMGSMFIIGLVLTIYAFKIGPKVKNCDEKTQNSARGILVMGVMMISVSSTFIACGCGMSVHNNQLGMVFLGLMLIVGISTISLSSIIHGSCPSARDYTTPLIVISVLSTVLTIGYLGYKGYNMSQNSKSTFQF